MSYQTEGETQGPSVETLIGQLRTDGTADAGTDPDDDPAAEAAALMAETASVLHDEDALDIDDGLVKESLPELLVMLVGLRESDAHGKGVMSDINRFFGTRLSPGTVYPTLHELDEDGVLEMRELVQTKEYFLGDEAAVQERLEAAMKQHLTLGFVFQRALEEIENQG